MFLYFFKKRETLNSIGKKQPGICRGQIPRQINTCLHRHFRTGLLLREEGVPLPRQVKGKGKKWGLKGDLGVTVLGLLQAYLALQAPCWHT